MPDKKEKIPFYKDENFWGNALTVTSGLAGILTLFSPNTLAYKIGAGLGIAVGVGMKLRGKYKKDDLPSGLSTRMDKISNKITGVRGIHK